MHHCKWFLLVLVPVAAWAQTGEFVSLMPKSEISELWMAYPPGASTWTLDGDVIRCTGKPVGFLINCNGLKKGDQFPKSHEVQGWHGRMGRVYAIKGAQIMPTKVADLEEPPPLGSWARFEITQVDGRVTVAVNGSIVYRGIGAEPSEGNVGLQSESWPTEFRGLAIRELASPPAAVRPTPSPSDRIRVLVLTPRVASLGLYG